MAEAVEEAIGNALVAAETMTGYRGRTVYALARGIALLAKPFEQGIAPQGDAHRPYRTGKSRKYPFHFRAVAGVVGALHARG